MFKVFEIVIKCIKPIRFTVWPAVIGGAAMLGSQLIGGAQRRKQYGKQRQFNKQMAEYEWKKNLEMWHKQNEYNSPTAQMKRFRDAGLNPNLIYGQGTPGNAAMMPSFGRPEMPVDLQPLVEPGDAIFRGLEAVIQHAKSNQERERAKQEGINTWIRENTKFSDVANASLDVVAKTIENRISQIKKDFWEQGINPSDAAWIRFGFGALDEILKGYSKGTDFINKQLDKLNKTIQSLGIDIEIIIPDWARTVREKLNIN